VPDEELLIGELARRSGLRPSAIRYYESIEVLPEPPRVSGRRRYPPETQRTLAVIGAARRAGLSLDEVRELLASGNGDARGPSGFGRLRGASSLKSSS
jgi:MerR family redox-sensitive transcriptional activator SoxR